MRLRQVPKAAEKLAAVLPRAAELHDYQYRLLKYYIEHYRVQKYAPNKVRDAIRKAKLTRVSRYVQLDTDLNQMEHPKVIMPSTSSDSVYTHADTE